METGKWTDYHPGEKNKQYNCGRCHTPGYSKEGHQESVIGITWGKKEGTSNKILNWGIVSGIIKPFLCWSQEY